MLFIIIIIISLRLYLGRRLLQPGRELVLIE